MTTVLKMHYQKNRENSPRATAFLVSATTLVSTFLVYVILTFAFPHEGSGAGALISGCLVIMIIDGTLVAALLNGLIAWQRRKWPSSFGAIITVLLAVNLLARFTLGLVYNQLNGSPIGANIVGLVNITAIAVTMALSALILRWPSQAQTAAVK